jgi:hypothetical protein
MPHSKLRGIDGVFFKFFGKKGFKNEELSKGGLSE